VKAIVKAAKARPTLTRANGHKWAFADAAKDPAIVDQYTANEIDGELGTAPAMGVGPAFRDFSDRYRTRFGVDPALYGYTAQSYDAMYLVMLSTAWGKFKGLINGANLAEGMGRVSATGQAQVNVGATGWQTATTALSGGSSVDLKGASGDLDFDPTSGAPSALYEVWQVHADGGISTVKNVPPP
jgi:branched-chain amino acid transport system substrate-binding protein